MTFAPKYKYDPEIQKKVKDMNFDGIQLPTIRKVYPKLVAQDIVNVQPMGTLALDVGNTYWVKSVGKDIWETCTEKDLYNPDYVPYFGIVNNGEGGYAVYDMDSTPIVCTDREIFKKFTVDPENASITNKPASLANPGYEQVTSSIFFMKYKAINLIDPNSGMINAKKPK